MSRYGAFDEPDGTGVPCVFRAFLINKSIAFELFALSPNRSLEVKVQSAG